jgi:transglutaminase-like putative cysteine protease
MGFEARYVPGLTYSIEGKLVPHAWAMVRLDGSWYHADPQLEDNIIKADQVLNTAIS